MPGLSNAGVVENPGKRVSFGHGKCRTGLTSSSAGRFYAGVFYNPGIPARGDFFMRYGSIPGVTKPVSRLVQGTANTVFDPSKPEQAFALLDTALEYGITTFDTAHVYGAGNETTLGNWVRERGVRDRIVILAKGAHPYGGRNRVTPEDIEADMRESMQRQKLEYFDLYVLHRDDLSVPVGPIVEALNAHQKAGRIGAFGGSNWTWQRIKEANEYAQTHGLTPFAVTSPNYSLAEMYEAPWDGCLSLSGPQGQEARDYYAQSGIAVMPWSSMAGGFFSDTYHRDNLETFSKDDYFAQICIKCYCGETNFERLDRARALAKSKSLTVAQIAVAFAQSQPLNLFMLVSSLTQDQFAANAAAIDLTLTPQEMAYLDLKADRL
jgi:aryl-alcohol dehydrogenase-like predicted oxidoreductase